jgi:hypothetical protein
MTDKAARASDVTIGELAKSLKVSQAWSLAIAVVGLLSGAFVLGTKFDSSQHQRDQSQIEEMRDRLSKVQEAHDFLTRYVAYLIDWRLQFGGFAQPPTAGPEAEQATRSREILVDLLAPWYTRQVGANTYTIGPVFDKTWRESTVRLSDGSRWVVPPEVKDAVRRCAATIRSAG